MNFRASGTRKTLDTDHLEIFCCYDFRRKKTPYLWNGIGIIQKKK